jgi:hypothetical protein
VECIARKNYRSCLPFKGYSNDWALTGLILVLSAAHLFDLPGKINLDRDAFFTVQGIYREFQYP